MTYSVGGLIQASDYNGFVGPTSAGGTNGANLNDFWNVGSTSLGWGQTVVANPSIGSTVTATQWATLVNNIATASNHTGVAITARTAPVAGNTISILSALNTDLTNLTNSRGNAAASGTEYGTFSGTTAKPQTLVQDKVPGPLHLPTQLPFLVPIRPDISGTPVVWYAYSMAKAATPQTMMPIGML
jgi:hypothetical protein